MSIRFIFALVALFGACGTAPPKPVVPPPPSSYDVTVGPSSVIGASLNKPYPGAALVNLRDGSRLEVAADKDLAAITQPAMWLEPSDPEIHFVNLVVVAPSDSVKSAEGVRLPTSRVTVGQTILVRSAKGQQYRLTVKEFQPGNRAQARLVVHVKRGKVVAVTAPKTAR